MRRPEPLDLATAEIPVDALHCDLECLGGVTDVIVGERAGTRRSVRTASGETTNVYARTLYPVNEREALTAYVAAARAVHAADQANPVDRTSEDAARIVLAAAGTSLDYTSARAIETLLARVGRSATLTALHPEAFCDESNHATNDLVAPIHALVDLARQLAAGDPKWIDDHMAAGIAEAFGRAAPNAERSALAVSIVRRWAGLAATSADGADPGGLDEVIRLRALVELAASMLDQSGHPDDALRLLRAAFPHRYAPKSS